MAIAFYAEDTKLPAIKKRAVGNWVKEVAATYGKKVGDKISGDLFISLDTVKTNSEAFNTPYNEELHRTIIHGILHLCGINDKGPGEREIMEANENKALAILPEECRES